MGDLILIVVILVIGGIFSTLVYGVIKESNEKALLAREDQKHRFLMEERAADQRLIDAANTITPTHRTEK